MMSTRDTAWLFSAQSPIADELVKFVDAQYDEDVDQYFGTGRIEGETYEERDGKKCMISTKESVCRIWSARIRFHCSSGIFPQPQEYGSLENRNLSEEAPIYWNGELVTDKLDAFSSRVNEREQHQPERRLPNPSSLRQTSPANMPKNIDDSGRDLCLNEQKR